MPAPGAAYTGTQVSAPDDVTCVFRDREAAGSSREDVCRLDWQTVRSEPRKYCSHGCPAYMPPAFLRPGDRVIASGGTGLLRLEAVERSPEEIAREQALARRRREVERIQAAASRYRERTVRLDNDRQVAFGAMARDAGGIWTGETAADQAQAVAAGLARLCGLQQAGGPQIFQHDGMLVYHRDPGDRPARLAAGGQLRAAMTAMQLRYQTGSLWISFRSRRGDQLEAQYADPKLSAFTIVTGLGAWDGVPGLTAATPVTLTVMHGGGRVIRALQAADGTYDITTLGQQLGWHGSPRELAAALPGLAREAGRQAMRTGQRDPVTRRALWQIQD